MPSRGPKRIQTVRLLPSREAAVRATIFITRRPPDGDEHLECLNADRIKFVKRVGNNGIVETVVLARAWDDNAWYAPRLEPDITVEIELEVP